MTNVSVPVITDNIIELQEQFDLTLNVPSSLGPAITADSRRNRAVGVISDSTSKNFKDDFIKYLLCFVSELVVEFTSAQFNGSESSGYVAVAVRISGGTSSIPITLTLTPTVQSPLSAIGMYNCINKQYNQTWLECKEIMTVSNFCKVC